MFKILQRRLLTPILFLVQTRREFCTTHFNQNKSNKASIDQEDKEELERERELREKFSRKIVESMPQYGQRNNDNCTTGTCGPQSSVASTPFFRFLFFTASLMLLIALLQISDTNSPFNIMQNMPWWQLPVTSVSHFILMRALLPFREQRRIKEEYEAASKMNPSLTMEQFFTQRYPNMFQGYRTQQQEIVAAVSACMATSNDLKFTRTISRAAGSARDIRASVDNIIDALKRDYPHLFQVSGNSSYPTSTVQ